MQSSDLSSLCAWYKNTFIPVTNNSYSTIQSSSPQAPTNKTELDIPGLVQVSEDNRLITAALLLFNMDLLQWNVKTEFACDFLN
jgi:hypothetical protein